MAQRERSETRSPGSLSSSKVPSATSAIHLRAGEKVLFVGDSGAGKTNLICNLLVAVERYTVIDSKLHPNEWPAFAQRYGILVTADPEQIERSPRVIFQISELALRDRSGWYSPGRPGFRWTQAIRAIRNKGRGVVVFDEVIQTLPSGATHPEAWQIYSQGAAFGISGWAGSQIPNRMETLVSRLAEHCFSFRMVNRNDQKILGSTRGVDCEVLAQLPDYYTAYHRKPAPNWTVCPPVPLLLPARGAGTPSGEAYPSRPVESGLPEAS